MQLTDVRRNTSHDNLLLASILNRFAEFRIIPSVHLALALDERCVRVHVENRLGKRAVGTVLSRRREHHRDIEKLAEAGVRDHGVVVQRSVEVAGAVSNEILLLAMWCMGGWYVYVLDLQAEQTILQIEHEEHRVVLVQTLERESCWGLAREEPKVSPLHLQSARQLPTKLAKARQETENFIFVGSDSGRSDRRVDVMSCWEM